MSKRQEYIEKYANEIKEKLGLTPNMDLLTKVTIGCGPAIYLPDAEVIAGSNNTELETVKQNFLVKKLGLKDGPELDKGLAEVMEQYGKSNRNKYRAVVYYLLTLKFKRELVYK